MRDTDDGAEILDTADLPTQDLLRVIEMRQLAFASWWAPGHPGWGIIDELESPSQEGAPPAPQTLGSGSSQPRLPTRAEFMRQN